MLQRLPRRPQRTKIPYGEEKRIYGRDAGVEGHWVGSFWKGLYQLTGSEFYIRKAVVFGVDEWQSIEKDVTKIELLTDGRVRREISGDDARANAKLIDTPNGKRYAIPFNCWTNYAAKT